MLDLMAIIGLLIVVFCVLIATGVFIHLLWRTLDWIAHLIDYRIPQWWVNSRFGEMEMNVYQSIKYAARKNLRIEFDKPNKRVIVMDGTSVYTSDWQHEFGLVSPVTALMRALAEAHEQNP